ncbi:response regulator [Enterobacter mori]|uniref:response regulator n=1 Tax=Enterobacter mori TaxID=539813 RepID=UPI001DFF20BF|nr:response regulator transcription factor [Enterobacter mori]MBS3046378.1 response regulator [Enterobacter mori]
MDTWLVVDDHPAICFAVKAILHSPGNNTVLTATNGMTALSQIKEKMPSLVILDIMLNKMDGLQILHYIRQIDPCIKVIVYTSLSEDLYAERALRAGASAFFSKDLEISQLAPLCQTVLLGYSCFPHTALSSLLVSSTAGDKTDNVLAQLSDRELTVLRYLSSGLSNKEIADRLLLSNKTISTYKARLMGKLNVTDVSTLADILHTYKSQQSNG